jgi:hypothetical protein
MRLCRSLSVGAFFLLPFSVFLCFLAGLIWCDLIGFAPRGLLPFPLLGERIRRRTWRMDPLNPRAPFHLPILHTLVEERAGVRRFPFRFMFMERFHHAAVP